MVYSWHLNAVPHHHRKIQEKQALAAQVLAIAEETDKPMRVWSAMSREQASPRGTP